MKVIRDIFILLAGAALAWVIFLYWDPFSNIEGAEPISVENEGKLGELIVENKNYNLIHVNNPQNAVDSAFRVIKDRLFGAMDSTKFTYRFYLESNDAVNAFALPGGNIVVFTGLIEYSESPEEVAAMLAHEIGHIEERHVSERLVKDLGIRLIFTVLSGGDGNLISQILQSVVSQHYNREQESEADEFGIGLLKKAKIHPRHMAKLFNRLSEQYDGLDSKLEFILSHPVLESRIREVQKQVDRWDAKEQPLGIDWERVKGRV